jgi:hypothetical protein
MRARDIRYQEAVRVWLGANRPDIAASFLLPRGLIGAFKRAAIPNDEIALSKQLMHCFNQLDRQIFKSAHRNRGVRVPRVVTLEQTDEVGWHAHVLLTTPSHISPANLSQLLRSIWLRQLWGHISKDFMDRLYWAEPISGSYLEYSTKQVGGNGVADWMNIVKAT